ALPAPPGADIVAPAELDWAPVTARPEELVVIVGAGELGPYGSARTRFEMEVNEELSAAGVLELAWTTGLVTWEDSPNAGWYDAETGDQVPEAEIAERYHDEVLTRCGIREFADEGALENGTAPLLTSVFLDKDLSFAVSSEAEARAFVAADPERTVARVGADGEWQVTRKAGTEIRVPRKVELTRTVGGQIPTGFDPSAWGIPADMIEATDRVAQWNLVCTVDTFLTAGLTPADELGAPDAGGQHPGHRHRRDDVDALAVHRQPARGTARQRHPAGGAAQRGGRARHAVLHRRLRLDGAPGRGVRHGSGVGGGGGRQDPAGQGAVRRRRRLRRPVDRGRGRLRRHGGHRGDRGDARQGHRRQPVLPRQRPAPGRLRRIGRRRHRAARPRRPGRRDGPAGARRGRLGRFAR